MLELGNRRRPNLADGHFASGLSIRIDIQDLSRVRYYDKRWHLTSEEDAVTPSRSPLLALPLLGYARDLSNGGAHALHELQRRQAARVGLIFPPLAVDAKLAGRGLD
jgi:hypothetical protein